MKRIKLILCLILMTLVTACGSLDVIDQTTTTTPKKPIASPEQPSPTSTASITTRDQTQTPSPIAENVQPELWGSQAMIEKNFKMNGFIFEPPVMNGEQTYVLGWRSMKKELGDLYDMDFQIETLSKDQSLIRANMLVLVPQALTEKEFNFVRQLLNLFLTSSAPLWTEGSAWVESNLPDLESLDGLQATNRSGTLQARLTLAPWQSSLGDGIGYGLTLWVDPTSMTIGDATHISVNMLTPLQGEDYLTLRFWDYEEQKSWSTNPACEAGCKTDYPQITVTDTGITVTEGFPVTHDQWDVKIQIPDFGESIYTENSVELEIIFHGRVYTCTNSLEITPFERFGSAYVFIEYNNGDPRLTSDDQSMSCVEN